MRSWAFPITIVVVTFGCFAPTLACDWISNWDDDWNFLLNEHYRGLSWQHVEWAFTTYHHGHYQPLSWISAGLDYTFWGMDAWGYHLTNVLLHCATAAVVYLVLKQLLRLTLAGHAEVRSPSWPAAVGALLFAIHPLRVESVAWITERRDVLSGLPALAVVLFYLRWAAVSDSNSSVRPVRHYWLAVFCFAASLFSKANALTLPVVLLVLDVYPLRRITFEGLKPRFGAHILVEKLPFFALSLLFGFLAIQAQASIGSL